MSDSREEFDCDVAVTARIVINENAPDDVFSRAMQDDFASAYYGYMRKPAVLKHWAYNAVVNGVSDASRLDGWADLERGMVTFYVMHTTAETEDPVEVTA